MCFVFHDWTKYEQYVERGRQFLGRLAPENIQGKEIPYTELRQKRFCKRCNKMQDRLVRSDE